MDPTLRDGRYAITRVLGEGAQGSTFEAVDKREGRLVAIKRFALRTAKRWKDVELAEREARVLAALSHPQLPAYVEHFEEDAALYLVMERMEGVSLHEWKKKGGTFGEADVIGLLEQAAVALQYLHSQDPPIVHRDLKPANVIRRPDKTYAFVDFGAVRDHLRPEGGSTVVGTFGYMAPEQFQGRAAPASDVYSIGATALWMLTGQEPERLPHKGLAIDVAGALGPKVSPELVGILSAMLELDPEKRASSIGPLLTGFQTRARRTPRPSAPPSRPISEKPSVAPSVTDQPPPEVAMTLLSFLRRFLPVFWVMAGLAWWWLPSQSATSFTIGLVVLTVVTRVYVPKRRAAPQRVRIKRYSVSPAVRVDVDDEGNLRRRVAGPDCEDADGWQDESASQDGRSRSRGA